MRDCSNVEKTTTCECECPLSAADIKRCKRRPALLVTPVVYEICATQQTKCDQMDANPELGGPKATAIRASVPAMAGRFVKATVRNIGKPAAPAELVEKRLAICHACNEYLPEKDRCAHPDCGCRLKKKARMVGESCPIGKW